ncbi:hypothetical protein RYH73_25820 [Olivibacter sp. CPCC 100613]|uniref:hypothetical protein n=1 Tax=Olivibacter sp. CPCC 100613 TaxID=3079931 RepID=UPI002FFA1CFB
MVETFTSKILDSLANDTSLYGEVSINAEEKLFYAMLQQPLDTILVDPSRESVEAILTFSKQRNKTTS